jgi:hypothetical protein
MIRMRRALPGWFTLLAVLVALPPLGNLLMRTMLLQMLAQIPLLFVGGAVWAGAVRWSDQTRWRAWNVQGAAGLLTSTLVLAFWMTPIALDHAAAEWSWEVAKIASVATVGFVAAVSWRLASGVTRIFYLGNMLWMTATVGMLYQESTERYCNAYLWDDQAMTGRALVVASIGIVLLWTARIAALSARRAAAPDSRA